MGNVAIGSPEAADSTTVSVGAGVTAQPVIENNDRVREREGSLLLRHHTLKDRFISSRGAKKGGERPVGCGFRLENRGIWGFEEPSRRYWRLHLGNVG